jgi:nicotinamide riboside kinase
MRIAILGAESTGKTQLAGELGRALAAQGQNVAVVGEYLREFCDRHGRTPRQDEQAHIALEQTRRIEVAARRHDIVVADTTALMTAIYSEQVFADTGLYEMAMGAHSQYELHLLTALDLPWRSDGLQRDGAHVREPVDARVRAALARSGLAYSVIAGVGPRRLEAALACVRRSSNPPAVADASTAWHWVCERCSDALCERQLLPQLPVVALAEPGG